MSAMKQLVIAGGGSAGWMTAALLARTLGSQLQITLVESSEIGIVGVGEAAIPPLRSFNQALGINEAEFMAYTGATFKLAIQFEGWGQDGESYQHAFGEIGSQLGLTPFHQYWLRAQQQAPAFNRASLWDYSLNSQAATHHQFGQIAYPQPCPIRPLEHAYHFDAHRYGQYLRQYSEAKGVRRIDGRIERVDLHADGAIASLQLADGRHIAGDLFVDCTGFKGRLIGEALGVKYHDWRHWLPCDRAWAVPSARVGAARPYTRAIAHQAGWQWRIPLQHRQGNGIVYSSAHLSDEQARQQLLATLDAAPLAEPRLLHFCPGRRAQSWAKNCVAIGLSSGFLEPLESTSIHLIQTAIQRLIKWFPQQPDMALVRAQFNQETQQEQCHIRDFLILHYRLNQRPEPFWQQRRQQAIPASLQRIIDLFADSGRLPTMANALFGPMAWLQVMIGQNMQPRSHHPLADGFSPAQLQQLQQDLRQIVELLRSRLPSHDDYLQQYCRASTSEPTGASKPRSR